MDKHILVKDYPNVLKFIYRIQVPPEEFRQQVLLSLANIFGYRLATFWLVDNNNRLIDPMTLSLDWHIMESYEGHYFHYDPFYPQNLPKRLLDSNVIRLNELVNIEEYKKNIYYNDILKRYRLLYKMVVCYRDNGKFIGASSFLRSSNCKDFDTEDTARMRLLSKYIARALSNNLLLNNVEFQRKMFESLSNSSSTGLFIFDEYFKILYFNSAALEYCGEIQPDDSSANPIERFITRFLIDSGDFWRYGLRTKVSSPSNKIFSINIVFKTNKAKPFYMVYIEPCSGVDESEKPNKRAVYNNLTPREREILNLVIKGFSNKEIADELFISLSTVKSHLQNIFRKYDVTNRTSLCYKAENIS